MIHIIAQSELDLSAASFQADTLDLLACAESQIRVRAPLGLFFSVHRVAGRTRKPPFYRFALVDLPALGSIQAIAMPKSLNYEA